MNAFIRSAVVLSALAVASSAQAAAAGSCSVTHQDCYPACIEKKMTADGEDCARTKQVCRTICGPEPSYPSVSNTERVDMMRFETMTPMRDPDAQRSTQYPPSSEE